MLRPSTVLYFTFLIRAVTACEWVKHGEGCDKPYSQNCQVNPHRYDAQGDQLCSRNCPDNVCNHGNGHCTRGCNEKKEGDFYQTTELSTTHVSVIITISSLVAVVIVIVVIIVMVFRKRRRERDSLRESSGSRKGSLATGTNMSDVDLKGDRDASRVAEKAGSSSQEEGTYKEDSPGVEVVYLREPRGETSGCGSVKGRKTDTSNICQRQGATEYTADHRTESTHDPEHMAAAATKETQATIINITAEETIKEDTTKTSSNLHVNCPGTSILNVAGITVGDVGCNKVNEYHYRKNEYEGVMERGMLDWEIQKTEELFEETAIYHKVKEHLENLRYVTIAGASGEGKSSMALMLGSEYQKKGYELYLVNNISKFELSAVSQDKDQCFIFDDIFGTVEISTDPTQLRRILDKLNFCLEQRACYVSEKYPIHCNHQKKDMGNICIIFTTKSYNLGQGLSHLRTRDYVFFKGTSVIDLTQNNCRYTMKEKTRIFIKHKEYNENSHDFDLEKICGIDDKIFGFPLTCKLFFNFPKSHDLYEAFFKKPLKYLRTDLKCLLEPCNNESAALILMLLCEGNLNLSELEVKSNNGVLENHVSSVSEIVHDFHRSKVAKCVRHFFGTYLTRGDITSFSHPAIYDACGVVLYGMNPAFVLQHCSIHFLYERVQAQTVPACETDEDRHVIYVSDAYNDIIASRLAEAVREGNYRMSIMHPILERNAIVDKVLVELKPFLTDTSVTDEHGNNVFHYACFSGNEYLVTKLIPFCDINNKGTNGVTPIMIAVQLGLEASFKLLHSKGADLTLTDDNKDTVLHLACVGGNRSIVEYLLPLFDINIRGEHGRTAVMMAAVCAKKDVVDLLLSKGADFTLTDDDMNTVLHMACVGGNRFIVDYLLPLFDINIRGQQGRTAVMMAAGCAKKDVVDLLLSKGADLKLTDDDMNTVLHLACRGGNRSIVEHLLPSFDINSRGQHGFTAVILAVICAKKDTFDLLVSKGADLTLVDDFKHNVLHLACVGGNRYIIEHLLPSFDINSRGQHGLTAVMIAVICAKKDTFDLLVSKGADLKLTDDNNNTVLHLACQGGNRSIVEHLLPLFDINSRGQEGRTAVMMAAVCAKKDTFDLLVSKGADLKLTDDYKDTVLHLACQVGNRSIVEYLLQSFDINSRGQKGWTAVMIAAVCAKKDVLDLLVSKGADLTLTDHRNDNVLHLSCQRGNSLIVEHLLPMCDINCRGYKGWTPVMSGAFSGNKDTFDLLINGANPSLTGDDNDTLLHAAIRGGNIDIVRHVIGDFDINTRGWNSHTPLMLAVCGGHTDVVDFLVDQGADVNMVDNDGDSLLHLACVAENVKMVKHVRSYSDIELRNKFGWTPLTKAAVDGSFAVFKYLKSEGAHLTLFDKTGDDLATLALQGGCRAIRDELGLDVSLRFTPWNRLMKSLVKSQIYHLLHFDQKSSDLVQTDQYGDSLLHLACRGGNKLCVEYLLPSYDIDVRGRYGWTPVMMAAVCGHEDVFQVLVSDKADLTLASDKGEDILTLARRGKNDAIVKFLCEES